MYHVFNAPMHDRDSDQKHLSDSTATCEQQASDSESRQQLRAEELQAITKAITIFASYGDMLVWGATSVLNRRLMRQVLIEAIMEQEGEEDWASGSDLDEEEEESEPPS